jgi:dinuclear metal center YbgI/SA1388 family protein
MEAFAPERLKEEWDNMGFMLGSREKVVKRALVALEINDGVALEAEKMRADMIITHHPLIFRGLKSVTGDDAAGRRLLSLIKNETAVYSAHTSLDAAEGGVNDALCDAIGLIDIEPLAPSRLDGYKWGVGRVGVLPNETPLHEIAVKIKNVLNAEFATVSGDSKKMVKRAGVCSGAGSDMLRFAIDKGCDFYVTGDVTHHFAQNAVDSDIGLIGLTHYDSEVIITPVIRDLLNEYFNQNGFDARAFASEFDGATIRLVH